MYQNADKILKSNLFIIDSKHLEDIESNIYGYIVTPNGIVTDQNINSKFNFNKDEMTCGAFIYIEKTLDKINIYQDFNGSFGLYLYKNALGNFCISNSFIHLVNYVKKKYPITFNYFYAYTFYASDLCSQMYSDTMVNEISMLPKDGYISIDIPNVSYFFNKIDYKFNSVDIDSQKGIDILDKWQKKWVSIIRNIKVISNNLSIDLSGGFDSRMMLSLFLNSKIDLNSIRIYSIEDNLHVHSEDYEIASMIANYYGFKLNNRNCIQTFPIPIDSMEGAISLSFYPKLCFHKLMNFTNYYYRAQLYSFSGYGGECLRSYWNYDSNTYKQKLFKRCVDKQPLIKDFINKQLEKLFKDICVNCNTDVNAPDFADILYGYTRARNHFGKNAVTKFFSNEIILSPLMDPLILQLKKHSKSCSDDNLLMAVIFQRFSPELLQFKFEGRRSIKDSTIEEAQRIINNSSKCDAPSYEPLGKVECQDIFSVNEDSLPYRGDDILKSIRNIVTSNDFRNFCSAYFYDEICDECERFYQSTKYYPLQQYYSLLSMVKIMKDVIESQNSDLGFNYYINIKSFDHDKNQLNQSELLNKSNIIDPNTSENFAQSITNGDNIFKFKDITIKTFCKITNHNKIYVVISDSNNQRDNYPIEGIVLFIEAHTSDELTISPSCYLGYNEINYLEHIKKIISNIQKIYSIHNKDITFISSNDSFASLYLANEFEYSKCIAIYSQIDMDANCSEESKVEILNAADEEAVNNRLNLYGIANNSCTRFFIYSNIATLSDKTLLEYFCNKNGINYHLGLNKVSDNFYLLITQFDNIDPCLVQPDENFTGYIDKYFWDDSPERKYIQINSYMNLMKKFNECDFRRNILGDLFSVVDSSKVTIKRNTSPAYIDVFFSKDVFARFSRVTDVVYPSIRFSKSAVGDNLEKIFKYTESRGLCIDQSENWANVYSRQPINKIDYCQWFVEFITLSGLDVSLIKSDLSNLQ